MPLEKRSNTQISRIGTGSPFEGKESVISSFSIEELVNSHLLHCMSFAINEFLSSMHDAGNEISDDWDNLSHAVALKIQHAVDHQFFIYRKQVGNGEPICGHYKSIINLLGGSAFIVDKPYNNEMHFYSSNGQIEFVFDINFKHSPIYTVNLLFELKKNGEKYSLNKRITKVEEKIDRTNWSEFIEYLKTLDAETASPSAAFDSPVSPETTDAESVASDSVTSLRQEADTITLQGALNREFIAKMVRQLRAEQGLSDSALAEKANIARVAVYRIENGSSSIEQGLKALEALGYQATVKITPIVR